MGLSPECKWLEIRSAIADILDVCFRCFPKNWLEEDANMTMIEEYPSETSTGRRSIPVEVTTYGKVVTVTEGRTASEETVKLEYVLGTVFVFLILCIVGYGVWQLCMVRFRRRKWDRDEQRDYEV